eukprot:6463433-Amphidinium_carterae.1
MLQGRSPNFAVTRRFRRPKPPPCTVTFCDTAKDNALGVTLVTRGVVNRLYWNPSASPAVVSETPLMVT